LINRSTILNYLHELEEKGICREKTTDSHTKIYDFCFALSEVLRDIINDFPDLRICFEEFFGEEGVSYNLSLKKF
jgi:dihydroorotase